MLAWASRRRILMFDNTVVSTLDLDTVLKTIVSRAMQRTRSCSRPSPRRASAKYLKALLAKLETADIYVDP
jgi:hypothetical protein